MVSVYCGILNTFRWAGACRGKDTTSTARSTDDNLLEQRELSVITLFCILIIRLYGIVIFIQIFGVISGRSLGYGCAAPIPRHAGRKIVPGGNYAAEEQGGG